MARNEAAKSADQLDRLRTNADLRAHKIVREQETLVAKCNKGIEKLNSDMKALKKRLSVYMEKKVGQYDDKYYRLKDEYQNKLAERAVLERARSVAEESIVAGKLHAIPGEFDRSEY